MVYDVDLFGGAALGLYLCRYLSLDSLRLVMLYGLRADEAVVCDSWSIVLQDSDLALAAVAFCLVWLE